MNPSNPSKFIGKKASSCRKCGSVEFYVNPMNGISCVTCYPPKKPDHVLLRLICEANVWTTPDQAFFVENGGGDGIRNDSSGLTSPPQAETPAAARRDAASHTGRVVVRRKSSEPYTQPELAWVIQDGGIIDQMAESVRTRRDAFSRAGETIEERDARLARFRGQKTPRRQEPSNVGSVTATLVTELRFVVPSSEPRQLEIFEAGTLCLMFPGRVVPERDPESAVIRGSLANRGRDSRRMAVVRLGGRLRIVGEDCVRVA